MHLAISMFLLVATGSAAPPPRLTCQNAYQSQHAVARGLHITKRAGERVWVRAVSASVSVFLSLVEFYPFGMRTFLWSEAVSAGCHFFWDKFRVGPRVLRAMITRRVVQARENVKAFSVV